MTQTSPDPTSLRAAPARGPALPPVQVMDTTLRDGEQTPGVSFTAEEKLRIARTLLTEVGVDRVEVCSARVSPGERDSAAHIAAWARSAGCLDRVEALGYCDGERSVDWLRATGLRRLNLLVKGSERHCRAQLGVTPDEHRRQAQETLAAARRGGLTASGAYLEDWSRGVVEVPEYVMLMVRALRAAGLERFYLADTLGVLDPDGVRERVRRMRQEFPDVSFEFHAHDDYGLATANCLAAVSAGVGGLHVTVNGLGERAGNASLSQVCVAVRDHGRRRTNIDETRLVAVSRLVAAASGRAVPVNAPIVGEHVFTQTAGIHADGDAKGQLYQAELAPGRFARRHDYALGKLSGRASLEHHLSALGISLAPALKTDLLARVIALGDGKQPVRRQDLPALIAEVSGELSGELRLAQNAAGTD